MKKKLLVSLFMATSLLSACSSGVSQEDYDKAVAEKESVQAIEESVQAEYDSLKSEHDTLQADYDEMKEKYTSLLDEKGENLAADASNQLAQAWVDTSFSGKGSCSVYDNTLFADILSEKEYNQENVLAMWNEMLSAIKIYNLLSPSVYPYRQLSISVYDNLGGGGISVHC